MTTRCLVVVPKANHKAVLVRIVDQLGAEIRREILDHGQAGDYHVHSSAVLELSECERPEADIEVVPIPPAAAASELAQAS